MASASALSAMRPPSNRDEAWRYAPPTELEQLDESQLGWRSLSVAEGETEIETLIVRAGARASIQRVDVQLDRHARLATHVVCGSRNFARVEFRVRLAEGSHFELGGVTLGGGETTHEIVTHVVHAEPGATSSQVVRSVHWECGTGNFLGQIDVVRGAQQTDAAQDFKGLLLDKGASAHAVPQLEIFADDVKCAHGATVGQLDEMARYYMAARGVPPEVAKRLLVRAFIADAFVSVDDEKESERLLELALAALEGAEL